MLWIIFGVFVLGMLALDLGLHRKSHVIKVKEALLWSAIWIGMGLLFGLIVYFWLGSQKALEYLTAYLIEESLSVDNLFVFLVIFSYFRVPRQHEHDILFWGIIGAWVTRGIFIVMGVTLIHQFHWILYLFGVLLIWTATNLAFEKEKEVRPEKNPVLKIFRKLMPVTLEYEGSKFFVKQPSKLFATPLFVVLLVIESTDIVFALDSIPAVLSISHDPFIVYTSNIFAILGLRSLFFALSGIMKLFHHLHYGLAFILAFVGVKMLIGDYYKIPIGAALGVITVTLILSVIASLVWPVKKEEAS